FVLALASFFPLTNFIDDVVRTLRPIAPPDVLGFLEEQLRRISNTDSGGILTLGILGAIWSSSAADRSEDAKGEYPAAVGVRDAPELLFEKPKHIWWSDRSQRSDDIVDEVRERKKARERQDE